ncbi:MAG: hypothetical protein HFG19_07065, partial [Oscillospiraceae bacterium]|nr:hypothetical protein [Oscillospiraceae bacterium]
YSIFIDKVQKYKDSGLLLDEAIRKAVNYCRENNIMQPFLTEHASEVENMLFTEWDWNEAMKIEREEGREEGVIGVAKKLLAMGLDLDTVSKGTGLTVEQIEKL